MSYFFIPTTVLWGGYLYPYFTGNELRLRKANFAQKAKVCQKHIVKKKVLKLYFNSHFFPIPKSLHLIHKLIWIGEGLDGGWMEGERMGGARTFLLYFSVLNARFLVAFWRGASDRNTYAAWSKTFRDLCELTWSCLPTGELPCKMGHFKN